jgi:hypothetical protein
VQEGEDPQGTVAGDEVEIGHAASEQRMPRAEVVMNIQTGHHRGESSAGLVHGEQLGHGVAQRLRTFVRAAKHHLRHCCAQHAGGDGVALGVIAVEEAVRRYPFDHLCQLPSEVHRVLHTGLEALSTVRRMHVGGVAGQQHPPVTIGCGLPGRVGEPGDPGGTVDPVVGPVGDDERIAEIAQGGFGRRPDVPFGHEDAYSHPILCPAERMDAEGVAADAPFRRFLGQLDLGDQVAGCRIPPGELDACGLADQAAASVAADEILRPHRLAVGQLDGHAGVVLRESSHFTSVQDRH